MLRVERRRVRRRVRRKEGKAGEVRKFNSLFNSLDMRNW